jgi:uncharacterized protein (TIGR03437 family)
VVVLFATGDGILTADAIDGRPALPTKLPGDISLDVGGYRTQILYAGRAPGLVGVMQINARLAGGFSPTGAVPVTLRVNGEVSEANVLIFVR